MLNILSDWCFNKHMIVNLRKSNVIGLNLILCSCLMTTFYNNIVLIGIHTLALFWQSISYTVTCISYLWLGNRWLETEGQLFDCSQTTYKITVYYLINDIQAREGNSRNYWPVNISRTWTVFSISENSKQRGILYDVRAHEGNSRNYWPVNSLRTWTISESNKNIQN